MKKILNLFGLTTIKSAKQASKDAVENALSEKPYQKVLDFTHICRK